MDCTLEYSLNLRCLSFALLAIALPWLLEINNWVQPFVSKRPRQNSYRGKDYVPQSDATTCALSSKSILLLWGQGRFIKPPLHTWFDKFDLCFRRFRTCILTLNKGSEKLNGPFQKKGVTCVKQEKSMHNSTLYSSDYSISFTNLLKLLGQKHINNIKMPSVLQYSRCKTY